MAAITSENSCVRGKQPVVGYLLHQDQSERAWRSRLQLRLYGCPPGARPGLATTVSEHSQDIPREFGYKAMQFNFVAASNEGAARLWNKLGFATVGRIPKAFCHPTIGYVDALVMYKWLESGGG